MVAHFGRSDDGPSPKRVNWGNPSTSPALSSPRHLHFNSIPQVRHCGVPDARLSLQVKNFEMVSVLAQERLLGFALGATFVGVFVFEQRRSIYGLIAETQPQIEARSESREPTFGSKLQLDYAHLWNKAIDRMLGPIIASLSSRGW